MTSISRHINLRGRRRIPIIRPSGSPSAAPSPPETGWTDQESLPVATKIYVSSSTGSDANPGTEVSPIATLAEAYSRVTDGQPDWVLFRRGDTWDESWDEWKKSGTDSSNRIVIRAYGDVSTPRPILCAKDDDNWFAIGDGGNISVFDIDFYNRFRDPGHADYDPAALGHDALWFFAGTDNIRVEGCRFRYNRHGCSFQEDAGRTPDNCVVYRCAFDYNYPDGAGLASGLFMTEGSGFTLEECTFFHNGYLSGDPTNNRNHNLYLDNVDNLTFRGNFSIQSSNICAKMKGDWERSMVGGLYEKNVMGYSQIGLSFGGNAENTDDFPPNGVIAFDNQVIQDNVFMHFGENVIPDQPQRRAIGIKVIEDSSFVRNYCILSENTVAPSPSHPIPDQAAQWLLDIPLGEQTNIVFTDNVIHRWRVGVQDPIRIDPASGYTETGTISGQADGYWVDYNRDLDAYALEKGYGTTYVHLMNAACENRRGSWDTDLTAEAVYDWVVAGYTPA